MSNVRVSTFIHLKRLAPQIDCNDIFVKVILLLTLPKKCPKKYNYVIMPRYGDIGVLNLCRKSTRLAFSHRKYIAELAFSMYQNI